MTKNIPALFEEDTGKQEEKSLTIPTKEELLAPIAAVRKEIEDAVEIAKGLSIVGHVDGEKAGYLAVSSHRKVLKNLNVAIEKARKGSKAPVLELERAIDGLAKELEGIALPELRRLEGLEKDYEKKIEEEKRIARERAANLLRVRIDEAKALGANLDEIDTALAQKATDEEWAKETARLVTVVARRKLVDDRTDALRAVGARAPFEIGDMTEEEWGHYLDDAVDAKRKRDEEAEEAARRKEGERRFDVLSSLGVETDVDACTIMTEESFRAKVEEIRAENARVRAEADELRRKESAKPAAAPVPTAGLANGGRGVIGVGGMSSAPRISLPTALPAEVIRELDEEMRKPSGAVLLVPDPLDVLRSSVHSALAVAKTLDASPRIESILSHLNECVILLETEEEISLEF